ncbi:hypothetical protein ACLUUI_05915 [Enterobacterales bacterium AW_CKDN230030176-1A_HGKHYDSX7]
MPSLLISNHVALVCIAPSGQRMLMNRRLCRQIHNRSIVSAACDLPHRWTIYLSAIRQRRDGEQYCNSVERAPQGNYLASRISDVIEPTYAELLGQAQPNRMIASGRVAMTVDVALNDARAARTFAAIGTWTRPETTLL